MKINVFSQRLTNNHINIISCFINMYIVGSFQEEAEESDEKENY